MVSLNPIMRKQSDKSRLWNIPQNSYLVIFKNVNIIKGQKSQEIVLEY